MFSRQKAYLWAKSQEFKFELIAFARDRSGKSGLVASVIGIFVAMVIGVALIEPLAYDVSTTVAGNLSNFQTAVTMGNLLPLFFVLIIAELRSYRS